jgi:hypothetical protein
MPNEVLFSDDDDEFSPKRDKIEKWKRDKKERNQKIDSENESLAKERRDEDAKASAEREDREYEEIKQVPITQSDDDYMRQAFNSPAIGGVIKKDKPKRKKPDILHPTLFDGIE